MVYKLQDGTRSAAKLLHLKVKEKCNLYSLEANVRFANEGRERSLVN